MIKYDVIQKNIFPQAYLSDSRISSVDFGELGISFRFKDGILTNFPDTEIPEGDDCQRTGNAVILLDQCRIEEMRCQIKYKFRLLRNVISISQDFDPLNLEKLLANHEIEVVDEFYSFSQLYWRCELLPYRKRGLSTEIEIYINGYSTITYQWNNRS